jgi:2-polyprenyl-6-methoxyphenol hydroxylase-like FAD-dependent oxidoreductase
MTTIKKVLVIGGGIGGLSAAISLATQGVAVDLVEIRTAWIPYPVGIILGSNTLRAMKQLGVIDASIAHGFPYQGMSICDKNGNVLNHLQNRQLAGPEYPSNLGMTRPALHMVLSEAAKAAGVAVRLGLSATALLNDENGVSVTFSDGAEGRYDLVVGADGVYSKTRSLLFGDKYKPAYTGQGAWRYNVPRPEGLDRSYIYDGVPGGKAGVVPLTKDTMYIYLVRKEDGNPFFPADQLANLFCDRLRDYGGLIGEVRDQFISDPDQVVYRPLEGLFISEPWYKGRVLLIGDAAHATTPHLGQGAAQAIEDAVVLGEEVATGGSVDELLRRFMDRRLDRCKFIVESSLQIGEWEQRPSPSADHAGIIKEMHRITALPI